MPEMSIAARALNLCAFHEERVVGPRDDILGRNRLPKARPASAGIELGLRAEQRRPAADASVESPCVQFVILIRERRLCPPLARHVVLLGSELVFPFSVAPDDLAECSDTRRSTGIAELRDRYFRDCAPVCALGGGIGRLRAKREADFYRERQRYRLSDECAPRQFPVAFRLRESMRHTRLFCPQHRKLPPPSKTHPG